MAAKSTGIFFHFQIKGFALANRSRLKAFLLRQLKKQGKSVDTINFIFGSDEQVLEINRTYLKHDFFTDIITFELSAKPDPVIADIYISIDRIRENAKTFKSTFKEELHTVIFHGVLHLLGQKDKSKIDQEKMRVLEAEWLKLYRRST